MWTLRNRHFFLKHGCNTFQLNIEVAVIVPVLGDFVFNSVWQINYFAYSANRHGKSIGGQAVFC